MESCLHILLAEDNLADVQLLRDVLTQAGVPHTLDIVSDGEEALRLAEMAGTSGERNCPDLFVLDLHLPKIDGPEVLKRFRANVHCAGTPVIVLSSFLSPEDRAAVEGYTGVTYFAKPSTIDELASISRFIDGLLKGLARN